MPNAKSRALVRRLLVAAAHPDDEVLGAGGTIRKRVLEGWQVAVVFMATGVEGRYAASDLKQAAVRKSLDSLKTDSDRALKTLGVTRRFDLGFPDNRMDTVSRMDLTLALKKVVASFRPSVVLTHHAGDYNWDHRLTFDAVLMACRANPGDVFPDQIYSFEVLSSTERAFQYGQNLFAPTVFEDIRRTIVVKQKALKCYRSETFPFPHPRSAEAVEALAKKRGCEVGLEYAEAFQLIRKIAR